MAAGKSGDRFFRGNQIFSQIWGATRSIPIFEISANTCKKFHRHEDVYKTTNANSHVNTCPCLIQDSTTPYDTSWIGNETSVVCKFSPASVAGATRQKENPSRIPKLRRFPSCRRPLHSLDLEVYEDGKVCGRKEG